MLTTSQLIQLPKAELHLHLDGSIRPQTMIDLAREQGVDLHKAAQRAGFTYRGDSAQDVAQAMKVDDVADLNSYLARFALTIGLLQTRDAIKRVAYEVAHDQANISGCVYVEIRYASLLSTSKGLTQDEVLEAMLEGLARAKTETGIEGGVINCCLCHNSPEEAVLEARAAARWAGKGVVGFDRAGGEGVPLHGEPGTRPREHRKAFEIAKAAGLGVTCHAGEPDHVGPEQIWSAIKDCGATRIGHAVTARHDKALRGYMRDAQILAEVNLTSNRQTRSVENTRDHPAKRFIEEGVPVTLCADNNLLAGVSLLDEYKLAQKELGLTDEQIRQVAKNSIAHSFAPAELKQKLLAHSPQPTHRTRRGGA